MSKRKSKPPANVDPLALAELRAASIEASIKAGRPLTRTQEGFWSKDVAEALQRRHAMRGYVVRSRLLQRAQTDDRLSVVALALKVLEAIDDRLTASVRELVDRGGEAPEVHRNASRSCACGIHDGQIRYTVRNAAYNAGGMVGRSAMAEWAHMGTMVSVSGQKRAGEQGLYRTPQAEVSGGLQE